MKKIKKSNVAVSIMCVIAISVTSFMSGYAVNSVNGLDYKSQGKIVFNNNSVSTNDDVIFDASDFDTIDKLVSDGKDSVKTKLNEYGTVNVTTEVPSFAELANAVQGISDGTNAGAKDIRKDKKALVGKNIVTGTLDITQNKTVTPNFSGGNVVVNYDSPFDAMQKVTINTDTDLIANNIRKGIEIFGITGNLNTDMQEKTITPNFASGNNVLTPDNNKAGMSKVTINTDTDLIANNIRKGIEIFGITGNLNTDMQEKTITPNFASGNNVLTPDDNKAGMSKVTINTDADLKAENIKKDVEIFGVTGTLNSDLGKEGLIISGSYAMDSSKRGGDSQQSITFPYACKVTAEIGMKQYTTEYPDSSFSFDGKIQTIPRNGHGAGDPTTWTTYILTSTSKNPTLKYFSTPNYETNEVHQAIYFDYKFTIVPIESD